MVPHRIRGPDLCSLSAICSSDRTKADPKAPSGALGRSAVQEMSAVTAVARLNRLIEHRNLSTLPNWFWPGYWLPICQYPLRKAFGKRVEVKGSNTYMAPIDGGLATLGCWSLTCGFRADEYACVRFETVVCNLVDRFRNHIIFKNYKKYHIKFNKINKFALYTDAYFIDAINLTRPIFTAAKTCLPKSVSVNRSKSTYILKYFNAS